MTKRAFEYFQKFEFQKEGTRVLRIYGFVVARGPKGRRPRGSGEYVPIYPASLFCGFGEKPRFGCFAGQIIWNPGSYGRGSGGQRLLDAPSRIGQRPFFQHPFIPGRKGVAERVRRRLGTVHHCAKETLTGHARERGEGRQN